MSEQVTTPRHEEDQETDGVPDHIERIYGTSSLTHDSDGDMMSDLFELAAGQNPTRWDSDGDGVHDLDEFRQGTNPLGPDYIPVYRFNERGVKELIEFRQRTHLGQKEIIL